jgi:HD-GYP domain-containing protein (c-di-GMP phosphodiesterase class II)
VGETLLRHLDSMKDIADWIRHHHEYWNGLGYPDGLRGEAIPLASRIIAVADAVDAMLTDRPYRKALSLQKTLTVLEEKRGSQLDPTVVDHTVALLTPEREPAPEPAPGVTAS